MVMKYFHITCPFVSWSTVNDKGNLTSGSFDLSLDPELLNCGVETFATYLLTGPSIEGKNVTLMELSPGNAFTNVGGVGGNRTLLEPVATVVDGHPGIL